MDFMQRMANILALLEAHPQGISVQGLADACGLPYQTMAQDLETLALSTDNRLPFYTDHDAGKEAEGDVKYLDGEYRVGNFDTEEDEIFKPHVKWFLAKTEQRFTPVHLNVPETMIVLDSLAVIPPNSHQYESLQRKIMAGLDVGETRSYRYIKGNRLPEPIDQQLVELFDSAIKQRRVLNLTYNQRELTVQPLGLVYYSRLRRWYLVAKHEKTIKNYNVANINLARITARIFDYPKNFSLAEWFAPRWGMEYGELLAVKVRFSNRSQTFAKVRKDVAHRQAKLTVSDDGQYMIMEDQIIGKNEFSAWLLGFGSAAEVLEPLSLRQEMIELVRKTLQNYRGEAQHESPSLGF